MRTSSLRNLLTGSAFWAASCSAVTLYAADSGGNVTTLSLTGSGTNYSLSVASKTAECDVNPSWLTLDTASRVLYCLDRGSNSVPNGSLNSFSIGDGGVLTRIARVSAPFGGVAGEIVTTDSGARGYVSASYLCCPEKINKLTFLGSNRSAAAVFALGDNGALPGTGPLQEFFPTLEAPGPVASRQDTSYLHHVIIDPKNQYVLLADLGGDRVRVYTKDPTSIAPIEEVDGLVTGPGVGPRHGVFKTAANGDIFFFFNGELDQNIYSYKVEYKETGLAFTKVFSIPAVNASYPATQAPTSEIAITPDQKFIIISNRDVSFRDSPVLGSGPSDTMSTFAIKEDGTLELVQLAPSGGWSPRQFSINKAGDLIAVGHQNNRTVVIWKRDLVSGKIIPEVEGGKVGQVTLTGAVVATIFDE
ncbi:putative 6-phosphogluconolactonase [Colletotrichum spaethianum]|uniref:6-phosphogluconolactonase n=1 Tax=Colletotrichum spaethianum TaxID=700344 RepID=A0AA37P6L8_9PEZI|nr:putative 6-phosphogluconolactonase [Colletotrichum spaethianum]GKT46761.1 putative 6-phosphogluconolactonase [Colletotrichum spaethianum]